jgi:hypothetical protein
MALTQLSANKLYRGLAVLAVNTVGESGATVQDSRAYYLGHADIHHGIIPEQDEPLPAEILKRYRERIKHWAKIAAYYPDSQPCSYAWTSGDLRS